MPDVARLKTQLAQVRPRLFLAGNRLAEIKAAVASGNVPQWKSMIEAADASLAEKIYAEPAGYPSAQLNIDEWPSIFFAPFSSSYTTHVR